MADVLVLNYNDPETTEHFVKCVRPYKAVRHILVVDNHSEDDSFSRLRKLADSRIHVVSASHNLGYGAGNNFGIRYMKKTWNSDFILICNPDVEISEESIRFTELFLRMNEDYAAAAPFMCDSQGNRNPYSAFPIPSAWQYAQSLGMVYSVLFRKTLRYPDLIHKTGDHLDVGALSGACFMCREDLMEEAGMFDENIFLYCEEVVLGIRFRNITKKVALLPNLEFVHHHSVSVSKVYKHIMSRKKLLVRSKLYVLKQYYSFNGISVLYLSFLGMVSVLEEGLAFVLHHKR